MRTLEHAIAGPSAQRRESAATRVTMSGAHTGPFAAVESPVGGVSGTHRRTHRGHRLPSAFWLSAYLLLPLALILCSGKLRAAYANRHGVSGVLMLSGRPSG